MSYAETMRVIESSWPELEGLAQNVEMRQVLIEVPDDWFRKFDIPPVGEQLVSRRCWVITQKDFEKIMDTRPGPNRQKGVGYRWKEVY